MWYFGPNFGVVLNLFGGLHETARVHHASRRHGRLAAHRACAAAGDVIDRVPKDRCGRTEPLLAPVPSWPQASLVRRGQERGDGIPLGEAAARANDGKSERRLAWKCTAKVTSRRPWRPLSNAGPARSSSVLFQLSVLIPI